jgi:hypothetical protein
VPVIEQILAAGAAAQNILLGLHNFGYAPRGRPASLLRPRGEEGAGLRDRRSPRRVHLCGWRTGALFTPGKPASVQDAMMEFPG